MSAARRIVCVHCGRRAWSQLDWLRGSWDDGGGWICPDRTDRAPRHTTDHDLDHNTDHNTDHGARPVGVNERAGRVSRVLLDACASAMRVPPTAGRRTSPRD